MDYCKSTGLTALMEAVQGGAVQMVVFLLKKNCDVNATMANSCGGSSLRPKRLCEVLISCTGDTALHLACRTGNLEIVKVV